MNVLIVDDRKPRRLTFASLVRKVGVTDEPFLAETIEEAEAIIRDHSIQIAIVDLVLNPHNEDGFSEDKPLASIRLIEQIREANHDAQIVAVTQAASDFQGCLALRGGANDFVSEDWGIMRLEDYLLKWLNLAGMLQRDLALTP